MPEYKNGDLVGGGGDTFKTLVVSPDGSQIVASDASGGATVFFLDLPQTSTTGATFGAGGAVGTCNIPSTGIRPTSGTWWHEVTMLQDISSKFAFYMAGSVTDTITLYYYGATTDKLAAFMLTTDHLSSLLTLGALTISTKYQIAVTFDGSTMSLYLDGVFQDSDANTGAIQYGTTPYYLAAYSGLYVFNYMQYSNLAIFDYALPVSELLELKAGTKDPTTTTTPALSWWPCTDTTGSTLTDTISGRNGACSGSFTFDAAAQGFTLANPSGLTAGQTYRWLVSTGGLRTATYGSDFVSEGGASLEISQGAGKKDMIVGTVSDDGTQIFASIQKDFS